MDADIPGINPLPRACKCGPRTQLRLGRVSHARACRDASGKVVDARQRLFFRAKMRLADEYDAAQERGEIQTAGGDRTSIVGKENNALTVSDLGLRRDEIHEARQCVRIPHRNGSANPLSEVASYTLPAPSD